MIEGEEFETIATIKYRHELAAAAPVASETDPVMRGQIDGEVLHLIEATLLRADDVGILPPEQLPHERAALLPTVRRRIAGHLHIAGHHPQGKCGHGGRIGLCRWSWQRQNLPACRGIPCGHRCSL